LKLKYEELLSNFAFKFNLLHYTMGIAIYGLLLTPGPVGLCVAYVMFG
jgi:hypothetical protein